MDEADRRSPHPCDVGDAGCIDSDLGALTVELWYNAYHARRYEEL